MIAELPFEAYICINRLVQEIESKDSCKFFPIPKITSAGKEEPCLAVADYVAGIFKDYEDTISEGKDKNLGSWQARNFAMLRSKIRVIHNYGTGEFFTRQNPFS